MYKQLLRYVLSADPGVNPIVTVKNGLSRIYPMGEVPQEVTRPFIVFAETGQTSGCQDTSNKDNLFAATVEITCVADSYTAAHSLGQLVRIAIDGYKGTSPSLAETIAGIFISSSRDITMRPAAEGESPLHGAVIDCTIWHYD